MSGTPRFVASLRATADHVMLSRVGWKDGGVEGVSIWRWQVRENGGWPLPRFIRGRCWPPLPANMPLRMTNGGDQRSTSQRTMSMEPRVMIVSAT